MVSSFGMIMTRIAKTMCLHVWLLRFFLLFGWGGAEDRGLMHAKQVSTTELLHEPNDKYLCEHQLLYHW